MVCLVSKLILSIENRKLKNENRKCVNFIDQVALLKEKIRRTH